MTEEGWASTADNLLHTTDNSKSWQSASKLPTQVSNGFTGGGAVVGSTRFQLGPSHFSSTLFRSDDGGHSWSEPRLVAPSFATSSPIRRLRSGRLLLPIYTVDGVGGKRSYPAVCLSNDRGRTWSSPHPIALKSGKTLDETDIFERKDGTLLAVMREVMCAAESHDGGETWSDLRTLGFPGHCPYLLQTENGVLLMAHRVPETSLHYSLDEGRTWQGPVLIDHVIGAYPSLVPLRDGRILCVYYEEGVHSAIRAVTIRVEREKHQP